MPLRDWLARLGSSTNLARKGLRTTRCLREAYSKYTAANREWLRAFRDLTIEMAPRVAAAARLRFSLQLIYLDRQAARFGHLLDTVPERLKTDGSLSEFVSSIDRCWRTEDEAALHRLRPEYQELVAMIGSVKAKAEEGVEGFSEHLEAVSKTERCLGLLNVFRQDVERIERELWFT